MACTTRRTIALSGGISAVMLSLFTMHSSAYAQSVYLDPITIIATKIEEFAIDALAPVSTVREGQIQQLMPGRPNQIFFGIPGVTSEATAQDASTAINIRGLQDFGRVAVIVDGARQNYARLGHNGAGSFFLETELLAEADIVRGPTANIYGSGAIGGVVSFRTKDPDDILKPTQNWAIQTNGTAGSNGFNTLGSVFAAARASPNAEYLVGATYRDQGNYSDGNGNLVPNSGQTVATAIAKAVFRPWDGHQLKFGGIFYDADWINGPTSASQITRGFNSQTSTVTGNWKFNRPENPWVDFSGTAYWNRVDVNSIVRSVLPSGIPFYGPVGNRAGYLIDTLGTDVFNTSRFDTGPFRHAVTYGFDHFTDDVNNTDQAGFGNGYNPNGRRNVSGGFAQWKANYATWLELISAVRYDAYSLDGTNATTGANVTSDGDRLSPKFTIGITPLPWATVYASYAEGYRAPAVTETLVSSIHPFPAFTFLPNPNLRPEVGRNTELGLNIKRDDLWVSGDRLRIKTSIFQNRIDDFIDTQTVPFTGPFGPCPAPPFCSQFVNVTQAEIEGVEFEGLYDRGDWFFGLAAHHIRGRDLTEGDPLAKIPADMVATTVGARFLDRKMTVAIRWAAVAAKPLSDLPIGTSAEQAVGSYNLVNLYVGYEINPELVAAFSVENLLDEYYQVYTHEYASPGITVKFALRKTFGQKTADFADAVTSQNNTASLRPQAAR